MNRSLTIGWIIAAVVGMCFVFPSAGSTGDVLIIANKDVPENSVSMNEIKNIFTGKKTRWSNNEKINFVLTGSDETHRQFLQTYIRRTPQQFSRYWKKQVFTGKGRKPRGFNAEEDVIEYVAGTPGAIGYISTDSISNKVKVLGIN